MYKIPVIIGEDTDYVVFMEPCPAGVLIHCDVRVPWTKDVKQRLMADWETLCGIHRGYRMIAKHEDHQGQKHIKFLEMFGFEFSHRHEYFDIYTIGG